MVEIEVMKRGSCDFVKVSAVNYCVSVRYDHLVVQRMTSANTVLNITII